MVFSSSFCVVDIVGSGVSLTSVRPSAHLFTPTNATTQHNTTLQLEQKERDYANASKASAGLELRVGMLQKRIMDVGGTELKDAKKALKTAVANVKTATAAIGKAEVDIKALEKKAIASEEARAQASKDHEAVMLTMQATIGELKKLDALASECVETFNEVQTAEQEKKAEVSTAAAALAAVQKRCKTLRGEFEKYKQNFDLLADKLGKVQHEITAWDAKIQALKDEAESQHAFMQNIMDDNKEAEAEEAAPADEAIESEAEAKPKDEDKDEDEDEDSDMKDVEAEASAVDAEAEALSVADAPKRQVLPAPTMEQIAMADVASLKKSIAALNDKVTALRETVDMGAIAAFNEADADWRKRAAEFDEATTSRDQARSIYEDLRKQRLETFMSGFGIITLKLKEMYQMITLGGDAELELVDTLDPFAEGIVFSVRPRGKSWKNIANLSGGEKTLSSLALVFALHHYKPTPLYVMDEIDAALDFRNVSIVANYIKVRGMEERRVFAIVEVFFFPLHFPPSLITLITIFYRHVHAPSFCFLLFPGTYAERAVYHYFAEEQHVRTRRPPGRDLQNQ